MTLGSAGAVLYGMISMLGVRIWVRTAVIPSPVASATAAIALIVCRLHLEHRGTTFGGIALGTAAAIIIYGAVFRNCGLAP